MIKPSDEPAVDPSGPMQRAFALARQALGSTSPNPSVGAVVVRDNQIIGEGFTLPPGQRHAEIGALEQAGVAARGATLHVTLEPCCNFGRTPPCTHAIIAAGIKKVCIASLDPNPTVSGRGCRELEAAGIAVVREDHQQAIELYEAFAKHINTGLPFVCAKFAMSLDGKIATRTGHSQWVTGPQARELVQRMRRDCDAVMVGVNTVLADNPQLTVRNADGTPRERQPRRVVLDSQTRTPPQSRLLKEPGKTLIFTGTSVQVDRLEALTQAGAEVVPISTGPNGWVDPQEVLAELGRRGVVSLLVEGGGTVLGSLFDAGLVDKVQAFIAPVIIGGQGAASPVEGLGVQSMTLAWRLPGARLESVGTDWLITGYPRREP